ncbi:protein phosphatase 2C domain-containing protein [Streptomyces sp. NPDC005566]|uniref:protein phosphatase 2C domain-containing protein n=1 Tax=Streptomyces sp. NPDC005566 TaxID=3156886 RepID=UPI0033A0DDA6
MRNQDDANDPLDETWRTAERLVAATPESPLMQTDWPEAGQEQPYARREGDPYERYGSPGQGEAWQSGQPNPAPERRYGPPEQEGLGDPWPGQPVSGPVTQSLPGQYRWEQRAVPATPAAGLDLGPQAPPSAPALPSAATDALPPTAVERPAPPTLGEPAHSGRKPPMYPPIPQQLPSAGADPAAAVLPDIVVDGADHGALSVRAASIRGDSHRYLGEPRQDALCVTRIGSPGTGELLLLAVADGVGTAARSHIGSNEACRLAAAYLDRAAERLCAVLAAGDGAALAELADAVVGEIAVLLADHARSSSHDPAAYATTLRVLLVPLDPAIRLRGFFAVGDGGTALLRAGRWLLDITEAQGPEGSGVIDTRTDALPLARTAETSLIGPAAPGDVLVLSTDGLSTPLAGEPEMREFLAAAWGSGTVPGPADFLWQAQFRVKSYDDDRSTIVLWEGRG